MNVSNNIERSTTYFPEKTALIFEGKTWTYRRLNEQVNRIATGLRRLGINPGDRVCLFLPNIPEFIFAYYGLQKIGAVSVSINAMCKSEEVKYIANDSGAVAIFTHPDMYPYVAAAQAEAPALKTVILCESQGQKPEPEPLTGAAVLTYEELSAQGTPEFKAADLERRHPAAILYTSGTTGKSKGALLSHENIASNMYATAHHAGYRPDDVLVLFLPLFHVFGQNFVTNAALNAGAAMVLHRRFEMDAVLNSIDQYGGTMFFAVPTIYIYLLNADLSKYSFKSVRYCFSAAATMPVEVSKAWTERFGLRIYEGYGLTETSPFACYNHDFNHKFGSIGTPIEGVEMKVVDENGDELPPGQLGEIIIRGPGVMLGYWGREEDTKQAIRDGWFHSGDIGMTDEEGYFFIVDRVKDMINAAGFKVFPREVEEVIYLHPEVKEVAVIGVSHPVKGEEVKAWVVLRPGAAVSGDDLIQFVQEKIATYKVPRQIEIVSEIPKSPTGKILKRVMRDMEAARGGEAPKAG